MTTREPPAAALLAAAAVAPLAYDERDYERAGELLLARAAETPPDLR